MNKHHTRFWSLNLSVVLAVLVFSTCGKESPTEPQPTQPPPPAPVATRMVVTPSPLALASLGQVQKLTAVVYDQNNNIMVSAVVTWSSGDANVAAVTGQGSVRAVGVGSTQITARSGSASATVPVSVAQEAASIDIMPAMVKLGSIGRQQQLAATIYDGNRNPIPGAAVTWISSNPSVATVTDKGLVTALSNGTAQVTATSGTLSKSIPVEVAQAVALLTLSHTDVELVLGDSLAIEVRATDALGVPVDNATIDWTSSKPAVVTVDANGLIRSVQDGLAVITASAEDIAAAVNVTVTHPERPLLVALYNGLNGPNWNTQTNWLSSESLDEWHGVTVGDDNRVSALALSNNNLAGSLPPVLGQLSGLRGLALDGNRLTGPVPPELGMLASLTHLYLYENQLTGEIPPELGRLTSLIHLCLDRNRLTGALPPELGGLTNLLWLHLHNNIDLVGPVPRSFTELRLEALFLQGTDVCVPDDTSFQAWLDDIADSRVDTCGGMNQDREILVAFYHATNGAKWHNHANWLTDAPLRTWKGVRTNAAGRVTELNLLINKMRGTIPRELGQLSHLAKLNLGHNDLTGEIPAEIGRLDQLRELNLSDNQLSGPIPPELGQLVRLELLALNRNKLSGEMPPELGDLESLVNLILDRNVLTGRIPPELNKLRNLLVLNVAYNKLLGPIPPELGELQNLETLELRENSLLGEIPAELGRLNRLRLLSLGHNRLTGTIPSDIGSLGALVTLDLYSNRLTETVPPELGNLSALEELQLLDNQLSGPIPPELGRLSNVTRIRLYTNRLEGPIPDELGQLAKLRTLNLAHNPALSGWLPRSMTQLTALEYLGLANTGVCVPADQEFTEWLDGLRSRDYAPCAPPGPDREVLSVLFYAMGASNWRNNTAWLSDRPLDQWYGVTTDTTGRVTALDLADNNLAGELPEQIGRLTGLREIRLEDNMALVGVLPESLTDLRIESLMLDGTGLCAPPDEVFQTWLNGIQDRRVAYCGSANEREALIAFYRATGGSSWQDDAGWGSRRPLGQWHGVTTSESGLVIALDLTGNNVGGTIHSAIGSLTGLESLSLASNYINGEIPSSLGDLPHLKTLDLGGNSLAGGIPPSLGGLTGLQTLDLGGNRLVGGLPSALAGLDSLRRMILNQNELLGTVPSALGELENLRQLDLSGNAFTGEIPVSLGDLVSLETLRLSGNMFTGRLPPNLGKLTSLAQLDLSGNRSLEGPLPREFAHLNLELLDLGETALCVPGDDTFKVWFEEIPERTAKVCGDMKALAYLTQATQTLADPVPLVAGEPALLRVFLTSDNEVSNIPPIRVTFYRDGTKIHMVETQDRGDKIPGRVDESSLANSDNAIVPGEVITPGLEMVIEIDPDGEPGLGNGIGGRVPESGRSLVAVREVPPLNLTMVPFISNADPDYDRLLEVLAVVDDDELFRWVRDLLPVAELNLKVREPVMVSMDPVVTSNNSGMWLRELAAVRATDGSDDHYMGMLRRVQYDHFSPLAELPGFLSLGVLRENVIAHALGHNMNLGHAPCGFRFVFAYVPDFPYPNDNGIIGSWGYDLRANELIPPETVDLMSNCAPYWISAFHFKKAMRYRLSDEALAPTLSGSVSGSGRSLLLWGGRDNSGALVLEPAFAVDAPYTLPRNDGTYEITGEDDFGNVLFTLRFDIPYVADGEGGAFAFTVPVHPDWSNRLSQVTLSGPEGTYMIDKKGENPVTLLLDSNTGRIQGFLRDFADPGLTSHFTEGVSTNLEAVTSRGVPDVPARDR